MQTSAETTVIEPQELSFLEDVFNDALKRRGLDNDTTAASNLAAQIIELYQIGVRDPQELDEKLG